MEGRLTDRKVRRCMDSRLTDRKVSRCMDSRLTDRRVRVRRCMAYRQEGE
jgi:hypothetical protein